MTSISVTEFVRGFADFINRVVYQGERFVLVRGGRELAEVRPVRRGARLSELPGMLAALPHLGDQDAAAFGEDLEEARARLGSTPSGVSWPS